MRTLSFNRSCGRNVTEPAEEGGEILFGGYNKTYENDLKYIPVSKTGQEKGSWRISVKKYRFSIF